MERQTGPTSPEAPAVSVDEDALVSQVLEIIGGNAAEALATPGEREGGDDSVFFSDEDQDGPGGQTSGDGKQLRDLQMHEAEDQSGVMDQEAQLPVPVVAEGKNSAEPAEETEAPPDSQPAHLRLFDRPNEEASAPPQQMSTPGTQASDRRKQQAESEPNLGVCSPPGFHQKPRWGSSTLPLPKKTEHPDSFDHLTSARYSTVSYRQIRRGNTRQKVEKFEFLIMNL